ncbi:MAG TPA: helix-turn-helix domain-containing protein [Anaeromyxobacteraceae bacterium]|nr:helix-turn-helix domain-containing protein [Anaeromyxobacteraceae bacterium]
MARRPRPGAHEALLEATRAELERGGFGGARVEAIARRAGMSKGAFYLHFRSKEEAFGEILQRFLGALEALAARPDEPDGPPGAVPPGRELDWAVDSGLLELLWRNRHLFPAIDGAGGGRWSALVADFRRRMRGLAAARIRRHQDAGRLRGDVDAAVVADVVLGCYEDLGRRMIDMVERPDLGAWARSFQAILYEGLVTGRSAPPAGGPALGA